MNSNHTKFAAVAVGLLSTWATAQADDFNVSVTPNSGQTLDNVELFSALTTTTNSGTTAMTQTGEALTSDLGSVAGGTTFTTTVSTSYGTSSSTVSGVDDQMDATFGLLATSNGFAILGGSANTTGTTYGAQYGSTGVTQSQALAGIQSDSLGVASSLFPNGSSSALYTASDLTSPVTGNFYAFSANGTATSIGTWSVTPQAAVQATPEPATFAALGVGALGLMRRLRKRTQARTGTKE